MIEPLIVPVRYFVLGGGELKEKSTMAATVGLKRVLFFKNSQF
jgi:hypothetical protein